MDFKLKLIKMIDKYVDYNELTGLCENKPVFQLDARARTILEGELIKLISEELTTDSTDFSDIKKTYRQLSLLFHPDKISLSPQIRWLEQVLSEGKHDGACFKCLNLCFHRLDPETKKETSFDHIRTMEDLVTWLKGQKELSTTRTQRDLYDSLIAMAEQMSAHSQDANAIKQNMMRIILLQCPFFITGCCAFIFAEELLAVYGLCFAALKFGRYIENCESQRLKSLGQKMQEVSYHTAVYTASLSAKIIEMTFWLSNKSYLTASSIAATLLKPMLENPEQSSSKPTSGKEAVERALIIAKNSSRKGQFFLNPQLKMTAVHLEHYLELNRQQWGILFRTGATKREKFQSALLDLRAIDRAETLTPKEKLQEAKKVIQSLKDDAVIYHNGKNAPAAIKNALFIVQWYESNQSEEVKDNNQEMAIELFEI